MIFDAAPFDRKNLCSSRLSQEAARTGGTIALSDRNSALSSDPVRSEIRRRAVSSRLTGLHPIPSSTTSHISWTTNRTQAKRAASMRRKAGNATSDGVFGDTRAFVDTREVPLAFSRKCIRRLNTHFQRGGRFLLDAGSGPIAHDEYLECGTHFERRVCVDLSAEALQVARSKLGERGVYLQADLTSLPIQTGSVDAVTCNHVIYQIPAEPAGRRLQGALARAEARRGCSDRLLVARYAAAMASGAVGPNVRWARRTPMRVTSRRLSPPRRAIFRIRCNGSRRRTGRSAMRSSRSA